MYFKTNIVHTTCSNTTVGYLINMIINLVNMWLLVKKMIEIVWSVNIMIAILIGGVGWVLYYIFTYDQKYTS